LALSTRLTLGQLDADAQLGHGDRRDGDVVLIGDQPVQVVARALRVDEEGRVE
jgi:hypothetical protein